MTSALPLNQLNSQNSANLAWVLATYSEFSQAVADATASQLALQAAECEP